MSFVLPRLLVRPPLSVARSAGCGCGPLGYLSAACRTQGLGGCLLHQRSLARGVDTGPARAGMATGVIKLAISPWGEVVIDGKQHGASPPLREVRLKPGVHRVEVSNGTSKPYVQTVRLASDEVATLRHR